MKKMNTKVLVVSLFLIQVGGDVQYLLSLIGTLGEGRCFSSKSVIGLTLLALILGSSSILLETSLLLLSPSLYLALVLSLLYLSSFSLSLAI